MTRERSRRRNTECDKFSSLFLEGFSQDRLIVHVNVSLLDKGSLSLSLIRPQTRKHAFPCRSTEWRAWERRNAACSTRGKKHCFSLRTISEREESRAGETAIRSIHLFLVDSASPPMTIYRLFSKVKNLYRYSIEREHVVVVVLGKNLCWLLSIVVEQIFK